MTNRGRQHHLDALKSIGMGFVLIYHCRLYCTDILSNSGVQTYFSLFFDTLLSTCVPLFFFVNGYLLLNRPYHRKKHLRKTLHLICTTILWGVIGLFLMQFIKQEFFTPVEFIRALFHWKQGWINHLWFMGALICIYLVFPLLKHSFDGNKTDFILFTGIIFLLTFGNKLLNQFCSVVFGFLLGNATAYQGVNFFTMFNPLRGIYGYAFVYFCTGGLMAGFEDRLRAIPAGKRRAICIPGLAVSCSGLWLLGIFYSYMTGESWDVVWEGYDTVFTFANVIFLYVLSLDIRQEIRQLRHLSENTLGIYHVHILFVKAMTPYLMQLPWMRNIPMTILYAGAVLLLSLAAVAVMKRIPLVRDLVR